MKLTGYEAIEYAEQNAVTLSKYTDPTEDAREGLTVDEARRVAAEDPSLIYLIVESGYRGALPRLCGTLPNGSYLVEFADGTHDEGYTSAVPDDAVAVQLLNAAPEQLWYDRLPTGGWRQRPLGKGGVRCTGYAASLPHRVDSLPVGRYDFEFTDGAICCDRAHSQVTDDVMAAHYLNSSLGAVWYDRQDDGSWAMREK